MCIRDRYRRTGSHNLHSREIHTSVLPVRWLRRSLEVGFPVRLLSSAEAVSYTHLDVYKRQVQESQPVVHRLRFSALP